MPRLQNKIAIVTGSSSGIGRAIALEFSKEGATVICGDLRENAREEVSAEGNITTHDLITKNGGTAEFFKIDVTKEEDQERLVARAVEKFGRLDMYVRCCFLPEFLCLWWLHFCSWRHSLFVPLIRKR
jgi:NAD(P)-dependent dehydrogenase (short-subunit alcohol dehydrogenase family)